MNGVGEHLQLSATNHEGDTSQLVHTVCLRSRVTHEVSRFSLHMHLIIFSFTVLCL